MATRRTFLWTLGLLGASTLLKALLWHAEGPNPEEVKRWESRVESDMSACRLSIRKYDRFLARIHELRVSPETSEHDVTGFPEFDATQENRYREDKLEAEQRLKALQAELDAGYQRGKSKVYDYDQHPYDH